jgi:hypothetical protein
MAAARGDSKPCTAADCAGTMQFGRRRDNDARPPVVDRSGHAVIAMNGKGWVSDADPNHFRQEG